MKIVPTETKNVFFEKFYTHVPFKTTFSLKYGFVKISQQTEQLPSQVPSDGEQLPSGEGNAAENSQTSPFQPFAAAPAPQTPIDSSDTLPSKTSVPTETYSPSVLSFSSTSSTQFTNFEDKHWGREVSYFLENSTVLLTDPRSGGSRIDIFYDFFKSPVHFRGIPLGEPTQSVKPENFFINKRIERPDSFFINKGTDPSNSPPVLSNISNRSIVKDSNFSFNIPAANDVDGGTLTYIATQSDGSALPNWITFNPATRSFHSTPESANYSDFIARVTVTDPFGASDSKSFRITIVDSNSSPTMPNIPNQSSTQNSLFVFATPAGTDPDVGDVLTYTATKSDGTALPGWLNFDPVTRVFSGTPANGDVGAVSVKVTATDAVGASDSKTFTIAVINTNDPPVLPAISNQSTNEDAAFNLAITAATDPDVGDILTYVATKSDGSALPGWLTFNPATLTFSGTPANGDVGAVSVKVTVTDIAGASDNKTFTITVVNTNDPPVLPAIANQSTNEDAAFNLAITAATDPDVGDVLTYTATKSDGSALPGWLTFNPATLTFSGTPANGDVGAVSVKVTVTDIAGASDNKTFTITVVNTNDPPVLPAIANQSVNESSAFNLTITAATDPDPGDVLTYTATKSDGSALPGWLTFNPATRIFTGTPDAGDVGVVSLKVTATDPGGLSSSQTFNVVVNNLGFVNTPPVLPAIANQSTNEDAVFNFTTPAAADPDIGDVLTYTATKSDGSALPGWLSFNPATRTFSGTPANGDVGSVSVKVTATDASGGSDNKTFTLTVVNTNDPPVLPAIANQSIAKNGLFGLTVTAATDPDAGDVLTYTATKADGSALPGWLSFNPATRAFSGTPLNGDVGTVSVKVTVIDLVGASDNKTFNITVTNANVPPVANTDANSISEEAAVSVSGNVLLNDTDANSDALVVSAINGSAANIGTSIKTSYGSVVINANGTYTYTLDNSSVYTDSLNTGQSVIDSFSYTVSDGNGGTSSSTLNITVNGKSDVISVLDNYQYNTTTGGKQNFSNLLTNDPGTSLQVQLTSLVTNTGSAPINNGNGTYTLPLQYGNAIVSSNGTLSYTKTSAPPLGAKDYFYYKSFNNGDVSDQSTVLFDFVSSNSFTASDRFFISTTSGGLTSLRELNLTGGLTSTTLGTTSNEYNSMDYRSSDNFIYGLQYHGSAHNTLYRINYDGSTTTLGTVSGLPTNQTYLSGAIDKNGFLYVNDPGNLIYKINIDTKTVVSSFSSAGKSFVDFAFNPIDEKLYAMGSGQVYVFDTSAGTLTNTIVVSGMNGLFGGQFFDAQGYMYGVNNSSRSLYKVDLNAKTSTSLGSLGSFVTPIDAAANISDNVNISPTSGFTAAGTNQTAVLQFTITNPLAVPLKGLMLTSTLASGTVVDHVTVSGSGYDAALLSGTTLKIGGIDLTASGTTTVEMYLNFANHANGSAAITTVLNGVPSFLGGPNLAVSPVSYTVSQGTNGTDNFTSTTSSNVFIPKDGADKFSYNLLIDNGNDVILPVSSASLSNDTFAFTGTGASSTATLDASGKVSVGNDGHGNVQINFIGTSGGGHVVLGGVSTAGINNLTDLHNVTGATITVA